MCSKIGARVKDTTKVGYILHCRIAMCSKIDARVKDTTKVGYILHCRIAMCSKIDARVKDATKVGYTLHCRIAIWGKIDVRVKDITKVESLYRGPRILQRQAIHKCSEIQEILPRFATLYCRKFLEVSTNVFYNLLSIFFKSTIKIFYTLSVESL